MLSSHKVNYSGSCTFLFFVVGAEGGGGVIVKMLFSLTLLSASNIISMTSMRQFLTLFQNKGPRFSFIKIHACIRMQV